eukprot:6423546-Pyramimonas_sp.AAC.1
MDRLNPGRAWGPAGGGRLALAHCNKQVQCIKSAGGGYSSFCTIVATFMQCFESAMVDHIISPLGMFLHGNLLAVER